MRMKLCGCLFALFILACYASEAIKHEIVEEKTSVTLKCPRSVEGRVMWSREGDGHRVQILTTDGDRDKKHSHDPFKRYSSLADKSLHILRVNVLHSGRYFCNDEAVVELTVIPSGTHILNVTGRSNVSLSCPPDVGGSDVPTWSREKGEIKKQRRFHVSPENRSLTIRDLQLGDSGLYYCGGKLVVYLDVTTAETSEGEGEKTAPPPTSPPPAKPPTVPAPVANTVTPTEQHLPLRLVLGIAATLLLIIIFVTIIYFTRRLRSKRTGTENKHHVYDKIQDGSEFQPTKGSFGPAGTFYLTDFSGGSNQDDPTYSTIPDVLPLDNRSGKDTSSSRTTGNSGTGREMPAAVNDGGLGFLKEDRAVEGV